MECRKCFSLLMCAFMYCRHVKVEGLQVISKSRCKLFWRLLLYLIVSFVWFYIFSSIFYRAQGAFNSHDFRLFHQPSRCCCFLTFLWISSLKLQTLLSAFWTGLGSASRRIKDPLTLAGWILFPVGVLTQDTTSHRLLGQPAPSAETAGRWFLGGASQWSTGMSDVLYSYLKKIRSFTLYLCPLLLAICVYIRN